MAKIYDGKLCNVEESDIINGTYNIGANVKMIGEWAFSEEEKLQTLDIPEGVATICEGAFEDCINLQSVSFPNTLEIIGKAAFKGCVSLKEVFIRNEVKEIGEGAFENCVGMHTLMMDCPQLTVINSRTFKNCCSIGKKPNGLDIVNLAQTNVVTINEEAFMNCQNISTVIVPNSLKQIGEKAFMNCKKLKRCLILPSVVIIGQNAFEGTKIN